MRFNHSRWENPFDANNPSLLYEGSWVETHELSSRKFSCYDPHGQDMDSPPLLPTGGSNKDWNLNFRRRK